MSKSEHFLALFQPTISALMTGTGTYLWLGRYGITSYIGLLLTLVGILSAVLYIKKLHDLPDAKLINSPETGILRVYMRGGLIASFIPSAVTAAFVIAFTAQPNDGVSMIMFVPLYMFMFLLPFVWAPVLFVESILFPAVTTAVFACFVIRAATQSACFLATNRRIDYSDSRIAGIIGTTFGTINIFFWLGNLSRVKKFAKIEATGGTAEQ